MEPGGDTPQGQRGGGGGGGWRCLSPGSKPAGESNRSKGGLRFTVDTVIARRGHAEPRPSEENARRCAGRPDLGWYGAEVVQRTVVTYTTRWNTPA